MNGCSVLQCAYAKGGHPAPCSVAMPTHGALDSATPSQWHPWNWPITAAGQAADVVAAGDVPGVVPAPQSRGRYLLGSLRMDVCSVSSSSPPQWSTGHAREPCPCTGVSPSPA